MRDIGGQHAAVVDRLQLWEFGNHPEEVCGLDRHGLALIMSITCPGAGQIYKGEILKGVTFVIIWALLLLSLFILSSPSRPLYLLDLFVLILTWAVGAVDAYVDDKLFIGAGNWLFWQRAFNILPMAVISAAVFALLVLWTQDSTKLIKSPVSDRNPNTRPESHSLAENMAHPAIDRETSAQSESSEFFSVQVAAFKSLAGAEAVHKDLLSRGYTVRMEDSTDGIWHRVLVGRFISEQDAVSFTETLRQREGFSDMIVRRGNVGE